MNPHPHHAPQDIAGLLSALADVMIDLTLDPVQEEPLKEEDLALAQEKLPVLPDQLQKSLLKSDIGAQSPDLVRDGDQNQVEAIHQTAHAHLTHPEALTHLTHPEALARLTHPEAHAHLTHPIAHAQV